MATSGTAGGNGGVIVAGDQAGGVIAVTKPGSGQEGESEGQAVGASGEESAIEVKELGVQVGDLDEYAEYFECFLKVGDCLPKIIVCGTDDEMPRIVVCEGLKRRPAVDATEETKKVLQEIQRQVAEMINAVQVNTILREEINHIEGECPVIKLKEVMKRINDTTEAPEETKICQNTPTRVSCKQLVDSNYCGYSTKSATRNSSFKSFQYHENLNSKVSVTDTIQVTCSMCLTHTQPTIGGCYCNDSAGFPSSKSLPQSLSKGSDIFSDEDIKALIDKCLGPPCNTCEADRYDTIVNDLDMEAIDFSKTGQKIYDIIVPPGYKDQQGWGGNHQIDNSFFTPKQDPCITQKYAETVQELKGELSKLDKLGDVLICGDGMFNNTNIDCESASCINAANYLNTQIAQIEEDLEVLRTSLERSRKERHILATQQNMLSCIKPMCYH